MSRQIRGKVDLDTGAVYYRARIRGLVILPPGTPRYYTTDRGTERYVMLRLIWRLGWMSFSYSLEASLDDTESCAAGIHDLERHANTGGAD